MIELIEMLAGVIWYSLVNRLLGRKGQYPDDTVQGTLHFSCYLSNSPDTDIKRIKHALNAFLRRHPGRGFYTKPDFTILKPEGIAVFVDLCASSTEDLMLYAHDIANDLKSANLAPPDACFLGGSCTPL